MRRKKKLTIGVVFGGRSFEHEVSLVSARSIISALDKNKYKLVFIGITKNGYWLKGQRAGELLVGKRLEDRSEFIPELLRSIDVFFPVLHGPFGEDGTVQGFFETLNKPYVGANVLGSSIGMDKIIQKVIWRQYKLPVVRFIWFLKKDWLKNRRKFIEQVEKEIKYPCFVKPSNAGSSVGISKSHHRQELIKAVDLACKYDRKILVEESIEKNFKEIEISVLGNDNPRASLPGQIISSNEFYDYEAKYVDGKSLTIAPAKLTKRLIRNIQDIGIRAYKAVDCSGMARIDFLLQGEKIYLNEINTIPGFTSISMYPKLWQVSGLSYSKLLDELINLAVERFNEREKILYSYKPKRKWYLSRASGGNQR